METRGRQQQDEEQLQDGKQNLSTNDDAVEADGAPVMDERDLEENGISEEEADNIVWDDPE